MAMNHRRTSFSHRITRMRRRPPRSSKVRTGKMTTRSSVNSNTTCEPFCIRFSHLMFKCSSLVRCVSSATTVRRNLTADFTGRRGQTSSPGSLQVALVEIVPFEWNSICRASNVFPVNIDASYCWQWLSSRGVLLKHSFVRVQNGNRSHSIPMIARHVFDAFERNEIIYSLLLDESISSWGE